MGSAERSGVSGGRLRRLPWGGIVSVAAGFVLHLSLGGVYTYGNLTTYLSSYLHVRRGLDVGYSQTLWVGTAMQMAQGPAIFVGSVLYKALGPRLTVLVGSVLMSGSVALTKLTVDTSLAWIAVTYGVLNGLGVGVAYSAPLLAGYKWFPDNKGVVSGIVIGGFGLAGIIFNTLQTSFLNPDNVKVRETDGFFHDAALLDRVPRVFLVQAAVCAALQLVGVLGVHDPSAGAVSPTQTTPDGSDTPRHPEHHQLWKHLLKTVHTLQLLLGFSMCFFTIAIINPLWKAFGQTFVSDDHFLEVVAAGSSAFNLLGRLSWGLLCDVSGYKPAMVLVCGCLAVFMFSFPVTALVGAGMYLVWVWCIFFSFSGIFALVVTGTAATFGAEHAGHIYGVIFAAASLLSPLAPLLAGAVLDTGGYAAAFLVAGGFATAGMVATLTFQPVVYHGLEPQYLKELG